MTKATIIALLQKKDKAQVAHQKRQKALENQIDELRAQLSHKDCDHSLTVDYTEDRDNGYGKWWKINGKRCRICNLCNNYPDISDYWYESDWRKGY